MEESNGLEEVLAEGLTLGDWTLAAAVFIGGIMVGRILKSLISRRFREKGDTAAYAANFIGSVFGWVLALTGFVYALGILGVRLAPLFGAIGIGGIAIALAAQSILANVIASILLQTRRPFRRGDQISSNGYDGVVDDVNLRAVALNTFDGERVLIPAADVLSSPIVNYTTLGARRTTLTVGVSYDADLHEAQELILDAVRSVGQVLLSPEPEALVEQFGESSIDFAVRYWHHPQRALLWQVRSEVAMAIKHNLDVAGINIPFPQRVVRQAPAAPKPATGVKKSKGRRETDRRS